MDVPLRILWRTPTEKAGRVSRNFEKYLGNNLAQRVFRELRVLYRIISKYSNSIVFLTQGKRENMLSLESGRILPPKNDPTGKAQPPMWLMGRRALFSLFRSGFRQDTLEMRRWLFQTQLFLPLCHFLALCSTVFPGCRQQIF